MGGRLGRTQRRGEGATGDYPRCVSAATIQRRRRVGGDATLCAEGLGEGDADCAPSARRRGAPRSPRAARPRGRPSDAERFRKASLSPTRSRRGLQIRSPGPPACSPPRTARPELTSPHPGPLSVRTGGINSNASRRSRTMAPGGREGGPSRARPRARPRLASLPRTRGGEGVRARIARSRRQPGATYAQERGLAGIVPSAKSVQQGAPSPRQPGPGHGRQASPAASPSHRPGGSAQCRSAPTRRR